MTEFQYQGGELDIFSQARNWKRYWASRIGGYLKGDVLEAGAGIGANTADLRPLSAGRWLCLEPDPELLGRLESAIAEGSIPPVETMRGTLDALPAARQFDTILYIDVLEHIEDDAAELEKAARRVRAGGHILVLSPAHNYLFSPFDHAIGHYRRYTKSSLARCTPAGTRLVSATYLDSAGLLLSLSNRLLLKQPLPTLPQIRFWDRFIIPVSRALDPALGFRVGKSVLGVWRVA